MARILEDIGTFVHLYLGIELSETQAVAVLALVSAAIIAVFWWLSAAL